MISKNYIVKHMAGERGSIEGVLALCLSARPYAYTRQKKVERFETLPSLIFVVESRRHENEQHYRVGYCFRVRSVDKKPGGALWEGNFTYRLDGDKDADFRYMPAPADVTDRELVDWLRTNARGTGVTALPDNISSKLLDHIVK